MVGLKNPCNKCLVQASCSEACDEYRKFDRVFNLFFKTENFCFIICFLTIAFGLTYLVHGTYEKNIAGIICSAYLIIGFVIAFLSLKVAKERSEDHLFNIGTFIFICIIAIPTVIGVIISSFIQKYNKCATYK